MDNEDIYLEGRNSYYDGTPNPYDYWTIEYDKFEEGLYDAWDEVIYTEDELGYYRD